MNWPYVVYCIQSNGKTCLRIPHEAILEFQRHYVSLVEIAACQGTSSRKVLVTIFASAVCGPKIDGARQYFFRREDVQSYFKPVLWKNLTFAHRLERLVLLAHSTTSCVERLWSNAFDQEQIAANAVLDCKHSPDDILGVVSLVLTRLEWREFSKSRSSRRGASCQNESTDSVTRAPLTSI